MPAPSVFVNYSGGTFPIVEGSFTTQDGITPGSGTITLAPGGTLAWQRGDISFGLDNGQSVTFLNCLITNVQYQVGSSGQVIVLTIVDQRYAWQFGEITGLYNLRKWDNVIDTRTEKTPRELATLCFQAMGVTTFDVSSMPNDQRPEVEWDHANPAQELARLCESTSCRICYQPDGSVQLKPYGTGADINTDWPSLSIAAGFDIRPRPDKIKLVGAETLVQVMLPLETVGIDGFSFQLIDIFELDYEPANGWNSEFPESMGNVTENQTEQPDGSLVSFRELALSSVWRMFRIADDIEDELQEIIAQLSFDPKFGSGTHTREHITPLVGAYLIETYDDADGSKRPKDAFVSGTFYHKGRPDDLNCPAGTKLEIGFGLDTKQGVVATARPVYYLDSDFPGLVFSPDLFLHIAIRVKDPATLLPVRYEKELTMPGDSLGTGTQIIRQEDVRLEIIADYDVFGTVTGTRDNKVDCDAAADYYLNAAKAAWNRPTVGSAQQAGVPDYAIDGAIAQLTYSVGPYGCTTTVSRGTQHDPAILPFKERRRIEEAAASERAAKAADDKAMRRAVR